MNDISIVHKNILDNKHSKGNYTANITYFS